MRLVVVVPTILLGACGSSQLSEEETGPAFSAMSGVMTSVQGDLSTEMAAAPKAVTFEGDETGWTISGSIDGDGLWTGTVNIEGEATWEDPNYAWLLTLEYIDVESNGYVFNGTLDYDFAWTTMGDTGDFTMESSMVGDMEVSGAASGSLTFDYQMTATFTGGTYTYEWTGTVNGEDVNTYSGSASYSY